MYTHTHVTITVKEKEPINLRVQRGHGRVSRMGSWGGSGGKKGKGKVITFYFN